MMQLNKLVLMALLTYQTKAMLANHTSAAAADHTITPGSSASSKSAAETQAEITPPASDSGLGLETDSRLEALSPEDRAWVENRIQELAKQRPTSSDEELIALSNKWLEDSLAEARAAGNKELEKSILEQQANIAKREAEYKDYTARALKSLSFMKNMQAIHDRIEKEYLTMTPEQKRERLHQVTSSILTKAKTSK